MRLSEKQIEVIRNTAFNHFGDDVHVFLFGSRTDPYKKGGDIDLLIRTQKEKMHLKQKLLFLVDLKKLVTTFISLIQKLKKILQSF